MNAKLILILIFLIGACEGQQRVSAAMAALQKESSYKPCGGSKVCVRRYLCRNGVLITDGENIIDMRFGDDCNFMETCCAAGDVLTNLPVRPDHDASEGCGFGNKNSFGIQIKKVSENEAEFGEFPWMVAVLQQKTLPSTIVLSIYKCGGSLITPKVVLTAAHCVHNMQARTLLARAGEWESSSNVEPFAHQERQVVEVIRHADFNIGSLSNDIALLILKESFSEAQHINTVCLPPAGANLDTSRCFATGWGRDLFENGTYANILKKIDLPVVPNDKCQRDLRRTRLSKYFRLHSSFMCAGGEYGKDTCKGDGGSPLVCPMANDPDRYFQAGIVAWGIGCGGENVPGVYASIPQLRSWIDNQLAYKKIDTGFFTP